MVTNTFIRIIWPCSYCPATQVKPGFIYSPIFARMLATVAEFGFYYAEAKCMRLKFFWAPLGFLTCSGETLCWLHIIFQSELIAWMEDFNWTILQTFVLISSKASHNL